jgi:FkbM family methyltransferase
MNEYLKKIREEKNIEQIYSNQPENNQKLYDLLEINLPKIQYPFYLRKDTSDIPTYHQVFVENQYAKMNLTTSPKVIIDGGSNIGLFTILMKNIFPNTKIIAIEPDVENFQMMLKNLSNYNNVYLENAGIWYKDTKLKVYDKYNLGKCGMIVEEDLNGNINAISMNYLINKYSIDRIDILKLDIETSEKQLFSENYENWLPKVKIFVVEIHDRMLTGCGQAFFIAVNKAFNNYEYYISGENTVIINKDIN